MECYVTTVVTYAECRMNWVLVRIELGLGKRLVGLAQN